MHLGHNNDLTGGRQWWSALKVQKLLKQSYKILDLISHNMKITITMHDSYMYIIIIFLFIFYNALK